MDLKQLIIVITIKWVAGLSFLGFRRLELCRVIGISHFNEPGSPQPWDIFLKQLLEDLFFFVEDGNLQSDR